MLCAPTLGAIRGSARRSGLCRSSGQVDFILKNLGVPNTANQVAFFPGSAQNVGKGEEFLLGTLSTPTGAGSLTRSSASH